MTRFKTFRSAVCAALCLMGVGTASATLIVSSDGVAVHDTLSDKYWLRDLTTFTNLSYPSQLTAISTYGTGNWRMASFEDIVSLDLNPDREIANSFLPTVPATGVGNGIVVAVYSGRVNFLFGDDIAMVAHMVYDQVNDAVYSPLHYIGSGGSFAPDWARGAWVVSTEPYSVTPIPEPETYAMLLAGLALLGWHARRRKLKAAQV